MIQAVLFDFGGVLTPSGQSGFVAETIASLYRVDPESLHTGPYHAELRRGRGDINKLFTVLNERFGKHITTEMYVQKAHESFEPSEEVYDLAVKLRKQGIKTGIFSNIFRIDAAVLRGQGRYDGFDPVILSCDEGYAKPDREFYEIAIQKVGVPAEEILFVDDQQKCLRPAAGFGMLTVEARDPGQIVHDVTVLIRKQNGIGL